MNKDDKAELREKLAAIEHERWSDWQRYCHSRLKKIIANIHGEKVEGMLMTPSDYLHWEEQIAADYNELSEKEKQSDRDQVDRYWNLIEAYTEKRVAEADIKARIDELKHMENEIWYKDNETTIGSRVDRLPELEKQLEQLQEKNRR